MSTDTIGAGTETITNTGTVETYTVEVSGIYDITADGAEGGPGYDGSGNTTPGGFGAAVGGDIYLQAGDQLEIIVGQQGGSGAPGHGAGGGGGGSFVIETNNGSTSVNIDEVIAGGGGGGGYLDVGATSSGGAGQSKATGGNGGTHQSAYPGGAGGVGPAAGDAGYLSVGAGNPNFISGGGGGGFSGGAGGGETSGHAENGISPGTGLFKGGAAGSGGGHTGGVGGFGGGGGGGTSGGGGGGGYGGGGGGGTTAGAGGGGGSFVTSAAKDGTVVKTAGGATSGGNGSVTFTYVAPCYCVGTLIESERGPIAVEELAIGDCVKTLGGAARPIKWIGTRSYDGRFIVGNRDVLPVCVHAGALADGVPARDLWISPHHALYLEGVLIEAKDLVNGVSITQAKKVERVDYFHIELESHDVIFAEGAPAESFIDNDSRIMFHNASEFFVLYPETSLVEKRPPLRFAARRDEGFEIEAARNDIAARAGIARQSSEPGALRGWVEDMSSDTLRGWARDDGAAPVCLHVLADGCVIGRVMANRYRADLEQAGIGEGRHAFQFDAPKGVDFTRTTIELRRASDGASLAGPARQVA